MDRDLRKTLGKAKDIKLEAQEKADIKHVLITYADTKPARLASARSRLVRKSDVVRLSIMQRSQKQALKIKTMPIALALILIISGGTAFAAEGTLPGDTLYPIKTEVNEEVRGWFAIGADARANLHARFAEERLEEAEELAVMGELTEEFRARLEERFEERVSFFGERIAALEADGRTEAAAELRTRLEAMLEAHETILEQLDNGDVLPILMRIRAHLNATMEDRIDTEAEFRGRAEIDVEAAARGAMTAAENKIAEVERFLENNEAKLGVDVLARAEARLTLAEDTFAEGEAKLDAGAYADAFVLFHKALRIAHEAQLIAAAQIRLDFDIVPGRFMFHFDGDLDDAEDADADDDSDTDTTDDADDDSSSDNQDDEDESDVDVDGDVDIDVDDDSIDVDLDTEVDLP